MFNITSKQKRPEKYDRIHYVGDPIVAELSNRISNPPEGSVKMQITPRVAEAMLAYNTDNRPISRVTLDKYVHRMRDGEWCYTGEPIIFSDSGRLIDGQHRLTACVESQSSFTADVSFGRPDKAFAYINTGKKRTAGDIFAINGIKHHNVIAATTRIVANYTAGRNLRDGGGIDFTPAALFDFLQSNLDILDSTKVYRMFAKNRLANPAMMAGLYVICARKSRRDADRFFSIAAEGFGAEKKNDPAMVLRKKLIDAATGGERMGRKTAAALTITAWNRMRDGLSGVGLKVDPEAPMPRVR